MLVLTSAFNRANVRRMEEKGFIPAGVTGGESIWISALNTAQNSTDLTFDGFKPSDGYTLAYQFAADTPVSVSGVASGDGWTLDITPATTLTWRPGRIAFVGIVTHTASQRTFIVDSGSISVTASPMRVSSWKAVVAACDAALLTASASPNGSMTVDGVSVSYRGAADLTRLRDYAAQQLKADTANRMPRKILTRFA